MDIGYDELTWQGRQLVEFYNGGSYETITYTYNSDGIRTSKDIDGELHEYGLNGSQIIFEKWSDKMLVYLYDEAGLPIGMMYRTSSYAQDIYDYYFFDKNLQGDIVAIYDVNGNKLVTYTYDAWGNHTTSYPQGTSAASIAKLNPFRCL